MSNFRVSQTAIDKFKEVPNYAMKLALEIMSNEATAKKHLEQNSILLTTRAAVFLMQKETGLSDKEFWDRNPPTPIRKSKS